MISIFILQGYKFFKQFLLYISYKFGKWDFGAESNKFPLVDFNPSYLSFLLKACELIFKRDISFWSFLRVKGLIAQIFSWMLSFDK